MLAVRKSCICFCFSDDGIFAMDDIRYKIIIIDKNNDNNSLSICCFNLFVISYSNKTKIYFSYAFYFFSACCELVCDFVLSSRMFLP